MAARQPLAHEIAVDRAAPGRLDLLARFAREFAAADRPETVLDAALPAIAEALNAEAGAVFLFEDGSDGPVCRAIHGPGTLRGGPGPLHGNKAPATRLPVDASPAPTATAGRGDMPSMAGAIDWGVAVRAVLWAPLAVSGSWLGAIAVLNPRDRPDFDEDDAAILETVANMAALAIHGARRGSAGEDGATRHEIERAAEIQRNLLPNSAPGRSPINGINRPARTVSGDFFDYLALPGGRIPFALGDVSGKGMNAALLMAKTVSLFRCLAKTIDDPAALLRALNDELCETAAHGMFVTMVAGVYDPVSGTLAFANAGHEPPLLRLPNRDYKAFPAEAPPLGIIDDFEVGTMSVAIEGGEFYIFSDGLTEFGYGDGEMLGVKGLIQMLELMADQPLASRIENLLAELDRHGWEARDDLTILTIDGTWVK